MYGSVQTNHPRHASMSIEQPLKEALMFFGGILVIALIVWLIRRG